MKKVPGKLLRGNGGGGASHSVVLHACTMEDEAFVGIGATFLNGVVIEKGTFVVVGVVVIENTCIPAHQVLNLLFSLVLKLAPILLLLAFLGLDC
jgi:hypothetical protein